METFGLVTAVLAFVAVGVGTPAAVVWAETLVTAAVAAGLAAALIVAAIVMDSWFVIPAVTALMLPSAAIACVARLRVRPEGETWADTGLEVLAGIGGCAVAIAVIWGLHGAERGMLLLCVIGACLEARRRAPALQEAET